MRRLRRILMSFIMLLTISLWVILFSAVDTPVFKYVMGVLWTK